MLFPPTFLKICSHFTVHKISDSSLTVICNEATTYLVVVFE